MFRSVVFAFETWIMNLLSSRFHSDSAVVRLAVLFVVLVLLKTWVTEYWNNASVCSFAGVREICQEKEIGIQFVFDDPATIEEVIRHSKVIIGKYKFIKLDGEHHVGRVGNPGFNYAPRELFRGRELKIKFDQGAFDPEKLGHTLIVVREIEDGIYQFIGCQTDSPANDDLYLPFAGEKELFDFGREIYESKKYRYEKTIEYLIAQLENEDNENREEIILRLERLGDDAKEAIGSIQSKVKQSKDPERVSRGVISLMRIGDEGAVKPILPHAMPFLIEGLRSKNGSLRQQCLLACHLVGPPAKAATDAISDMLNELVERRKRQAIKSIEDFEYVVVPMIEALATIDGTHEKSVHTFKSLLNHESTIVRDAAQRALDRK